MNPMKLMQLQAVWNQFRGTHPRFPMFLNAVAENAIQEGTVLEFHVTTPEGKTYQSNLKLTASDLEAIRTLKEAIKE